MHQIQRRSRNLVRTLTQKDTTITALEALTQAGKHLASNKITVEYLAGTQAYQEGYEQAHLHSLKIINGLIDTLSEEGTINDPEE